MTQFGMYKEPVLLDFETHGNLKLTSPTDHAMSAAMHASFLTAVEFTSAAHEFVIMFVQDLVDGKPQVVPIALLGVAAGENLYLDGTRWDARYVPAFIRRYPFWLGKTEGMTEPVVTIDRAWAGFSETDGEPLFDAERKPAKRLSEALEFMSRFEAEAARTLPFCQRLLELGLLREMTAKVTLADGQNLALDGLLTVDDAKLQALPDAQVLELHRSGMLGLIHAHLLSLANMQALVERKAQRTQRTAAH